MKIEENPDVKLLTAQEEHEKYGRMVKALIDDKWQTVYVFWKDGVSVGVNKEFMDVQSKRSDDRRVMAFTHAEFTLMEKLKEVYEGKDPDEIDWSDTPFNFKGNHYEASFESFIGPEEAE